VDVEEYIARLEQVLEEARPVPLSSTVMVHRDEMDRLLGRLREALPVQLRQSRWVLRERDELLAQAARESEQLVADARAEQGRLIEETEVARSARREAERVLSEARDHARAVRLEAEDDADAKLANLESLLQRMLTLVETGREELRGATGEVTVPEAGAEPKQFFDHEADVRHLPLDRS
jgi:cell division septum initiation protein DivIVA